MILIAVLALFVPARSTPSVDGSVYYDAATRKFTFQEGLDPTAAAYATFTDEIFTTGWSRLTVTTNGLYDDRIQAFAAGFVESHLTYELIHNHNINTVGSYCSQPSSYCSRLESYLNQQTRWINDQIQKNNSDYWYQISLILHQLEGIQYGYGNVTQGKDGYDISPRHFLLMNLDGDLEDLEVALGAPASSQRRIMGSGSCSSLIKVLPEMSDVLVSHDMWGTYHSMLRIFKLYNFSLHQHRHGELIPGHKIAFSSYPATLVSLDDFYMLSSRLVTLETTIGNSNEERWKYVKPEGTLSYWMRVIVANRMSTAGRGWCEMFEKYNSGTYNNEWMIFDYKRFQPGSHRIEHDTFWVLEQIPGYVEYHDMSEVLNVKGYWGSYNNPAFPKVANMSGIPELIKKYGDYFDHDKAPRARIYARNQSQVTDLESMYKLQRYNNFQHDPLSRCNCTPPYSAENSIAARSDLNPASGIYEFPALGHRPHGATDCKITSSEMIKTLSCLAESGPTHQQQPVFQWSTSTFSNLSHLGMPDRYDFTPITIHWDL